MASITVPEETDPREDAEQLYTAFKGFGTDNSTVIDILAHRNAEQRAQIQQEYKILHHKELEKRLRSELSGDFEKAVLLWLPDPATRDAIMLKELLHKKKHIPIRPVIEVLCSRNPTQMQEIKDTYFEMCGVHLQHELEHLKGDSDSKKLVRAYEQAQREDGNETEEEIVENDANALYRAGEKRLGTDEDVFISVFSERSYPHLAAVSAAYKNMYGDLEKAVKSETSGDFEFGLLTILHCAENPAAYFSDELYKAMKGFGTDEDTLIRIIVSRAEIDMQYIKEEYQSKHGKTLYHAVHSETSGHFRDFLLALLGQDE